MLRPRREVKSEIELLGILRPQCRRPTREKTGSGNDIRRADGISINFEAQSAFKGRVAGWVHQRNRRSRQRRTAGSVGTSSFGIEWLGVTFLDEPRGVFGCNPNTG